LALATAGCYKNYEAPPLDTEASSSGGRAAVSGGASSTNSGGEPATGAQAGEGGTTEVTGKGGTSASAGSPSREEGGTPGAGGAQEGGETGGSVAVAGASGAGAEASGGAGAEASGGAQATGGTASTAGAPQGGSGGGAVVEESICVDDAGAPVPYDFSFGIASEYAFELSMNCDVGGYLMPLVLADPEQLSQVNDFVLVATDWYRSEVLSCPDESSSLGKDSYGLLPASQSSDLSDADFDASMALFMSIVDRHDGQPDQVSPQKKDKIKKRIKSVKGRAVHNAAAGLTKTLPEGECVPAAPPEGGG